MGYLGRFFRIVRFSGLRGSAASVWGALTMDQPLHSALFVPPEGPRLQGRGVQLEPVPAQHKSSGGPQAPVCEPEPCECPCARVAITPQARVNAEPRGSDSSEESICWCSQLCSPFFCQMEGAWLGREGKAGYKFSPISFLPSCLSPFSVTVTKPPKLGFI